MTREQLVPTLEICERLKAAGYPQNISCYAYFQLNSDKEIFLLDREYVTALFGEPDEKTDYVMLANAPTLQELLVELPLYTDVLKASGEYQLSADAYYASHPNPAEAASLLWLQLRKEEKL